MRALISVYDKEGLKDLAEGLVRLGCEIVASGGTSLALSEFGVVHETVESITGYGHLLSGRVKTLHPKIHGAILANLNDPSHMQDLRKLDIKPFDLVVCNLYPFDSNPSVDLIDIGGPAMVRAAAKNYEHVAVVISPSDYSVVLEELQKNQKLSLETRIKLAAKAFRYCSNYDASVAEWMDTLSGTDSDDLTLPPLITLQLRKASDLRYGENPHQKGARYVRGNEESWFDKAKQYGEKALSYLNIFDANAAWRLASEISNLSPEKPFGCCIVKHANACGAALGSSTLESYQKALEADPISAFGGVVAVFGRVDDDLAEAIKQGPQADVLIALDFVEGAPEKLLEKRKNLRILQAPPPGFRKLDYRTIDGGFLVQEPDYVKLQSESWKVVSAKEPSYEEMLDLQLAWLVCARTTSNAIVIAKDKQIVGVGAGQQSRVGSCEIAISKAGSRAIGSVGASDAFFPFRDGLDVLIDSGVTAVIEPGGSIKDDEIIQAANEKGASLIFTGERHFRH